MFEITLRENERRRIELTPVQVEELVSIGRVLAGRRASWLKSEPDDLESEPDRSAIQVQSAGSGQFTISFSNVIGVIALTSLTIRIVPKIRLNHFLYIAAHALEIEPRLSEIPAGVEPNSLLQEIIARSFVAEVERSVRRSLHRGYSERAYESASIRGRVNIVETSRLVLQGRMRARGIADEYVADTSLNRLVKEALGRTGRTRHFTSATRGSARALLGHFSEVGAFSRTDLRPSLTRAQIQFSRLAELARIVVEASGVGIAQGSAPVDSFLLTTPDLVEIGVRRMLARELAPLEVVKHGGGKVLVRSPQFRVQPDLLISKASLTGDVKYQVSRGGWNRSAVGQAVLFAAAYGSPLGFIVGFSERDDAALPRLALGAITVHEVWWRAGPSVTPDEAAREVALQVRTAIGALASSAAAFK